MKNKPYIVDCPICGRNLLKSRCGSNVEISCPKCHVTYDVKHDEKGMLVMEPLDYNYKAE